MSYLLLENGTDRLLLESGAGLLLLESISPAVSPPSATINQLATQSLTASNFTGGAVTWSSSNPAAATVNSSGVVTGVAHGQATAQNSTITATGVSVPSETATSVITVRAVAVTVAPTTGSIGVNATLQVTPTVIGSTNTAVTWSVVSGGGSVNGSGLYTAPATATTADVRATSTADTNRFADCTITVTLNRVIDIQAVYGSGFTGASIGTTIYNPDGTIYQAHTTVGVNELSGTGIYGIEDNLPQSFFGLIYFDPPAGSGLDGYVHIIRPWYSGTTYQDIPLAPYGLAYSGGAGFSGGTVGYKIISAVDMSTVLVAHTTVGVVEYGSLGIYGIPNTYNLTQAGILIWDAPTGVQPFTHNFLQMEPLTLLQPIFSSRRVVR